MEYDILRTVLMALMLFFITYFVWYYLKYIFTFNTITFKSILAFTLTYNLAALDVQAQEVLLYDVLFVFHFCWCLAYDLLTQNVLDYYDHNLAG